MSEHNSDLKTLFTSSWHNYLMSGETRSWNNANTTQESGITTHAFSG
jgi:hypothetical protein